ncbi:transposase [Paenibacillus thermotolerans]|uniref:transposase n=1 Tax=Paenibacillus thermotolerans TaxID=3027807 RepID=UPI002367F03F|nr:MULTISPECIES: transposase [unclassified Paenibacillus]
MGEIRQHYNDEFKMRTVKYIQENQKSIPEYAQELNIPVKTLRGWMEKYREFENEPLVSKDLLKEKDRVIADQAAAIADLQEELAILKKAVHIFSKQRN